MYIHVFFKKEINIIIKRICVISVRKHLKYISYYENVYFEEKGERENEKATLRENLILCKHI